MSYVTEVLIFLWLNGANCFKSRHVGGGWETTLQLLVAFCQRNHNVLQMYTNHLRGQQEVSVQRMKICRWIMN